MVFELELLNLVCPFCHEHAPILLLCLQHGDAGPEFLNFVILQVKLGHARFVIGPSLEFGYFLFKSMYHIVFVVNLLAKKVDLGFK